jgi:hypothetical protein
VIAPGDVNLPRRNVLVPRARRLTRPASQRAAAR